MNNILHQIIEKLSAIEDQDNMVGITLYKNNNNEYYADTMLLKELEDPDNLNHIKRICFVDKQNTVDDALISLDKEVDAYISKISQSINLSKIYVYKGGRKFKLVDVTDEEDA